VANDVNSKLKSMSSRSKKIRDDIEALVKDLASLNGELKKKYQDEVAYSGSYEGLEMFNALNNQVSKNLNSARNALVLFKKLKDLSSFNVAEIEEDVISGNVEKLLS
jgi:predicted transcriptional regulator